MSSRLAATVIVLAAVLIVGALIFGAFTGQFGGGGTFADDANRACHGHGGVREMNAHQGGVVCMDGWAVAP